MRVIWHWSSRLLKYAVTGTEVTNACELSWVSHSRLLLSMRVRSDCEVAMVRMRRWMTTLDGEVPKGLSKEPVRCLNSNIRDPFGAGPKYVWIHEWYWNQDSEVINSCESITIVYRYK